MLIFDPVKTPIDRCFVLAKLHETNLLVFRQLLIDSNQSYLKSLNPDLMGLPMRALSKKDQIIAILVEARQIYPN
jgi:SOS-response transcriptional repressor LexA